MGKRFIIAILTILITSLKFVVNMTSIGISFITKKNIPTIEALHNMSIPYKKQESIKYVVEHNENNTQVEMSEYNPKIREIRDLLD